MNLIDFLKSQFGIPASVIFIGSLLVCLGALWAAREALQNERKLNEKNEQIAELTNKNLQLSEENKKLIENSLAELTGGQSWAYLDVGVRTKKGVMPTSGIILEFVGKHPLTDAKITIMKREKVAESGAQTFVGFAKYDLPVIKPASLTNTNILGTWNLQGTDDIAFLVNIETRNVSIEQAIYFKRDADNNWLMGTKVQRHVPLGNGGFRPEILLERFDPGFSPDGLRWPGMFN
jgi:hypothetical protein